MRLSGNADKSPQDQNHHYVIQNVVEKLKERGSITTNVLEGLKVVEIIERIYSVRDAQWKK